MTQLTYSPGTKFRPVESGKHVYYYKPVTTASFASIDTAIHAHDICRVPSEGGDEEFVVDRVPYHYWAIWRGNLVYVRYTESGVAALEIKDLETGEVRGLREFSSDTELALQRVPYMPVSPDGHWILLTKNDHSGSDLMLVENFD
jgi:hypothetical protein